MFSPSFKSPQIPPYSPSLAFSPNAGSPYRLPPIPKSTSGNDLVSGIVDKFNSLSMTDREDERDKYERHINKLKSALDRACMAREEAETEARRLREKLLEVQDERVKERDDLRSKCGEWEKKYEKAKDRFKLQRARNEEATHKLQSDFLEKEKAHWRNVAIAQEAEEWERRLRHDAHDLVAFVELERRFEMEVTRTRRDMTSSRTTSRSTSSEERMQLERPESRTRGASQAEREASQQPQNEPEHRSRPGSSHSTTSDHDTRREQSTDTHLKTSTISLRDITPDGPPSIPILPFQTPARQTTRVPVDFGSENKENTAPTFALNDSVADVLKTPMTMDRAAALAAIEYRRGRAKSFMNAQMTPRTLAVGDKRDLSAPALVTMSVGRKGKV